MLDGRGLRLAIEDEQAAMATPQVGSASAPAFRTDGFDPWRLFRLLRRQIWTLLAVVVAVNLLTALALFLVTPTYKASALVIVDPWQHSVLDADRGGAGLPADAARVESEVEILRSPAVLLSVVEKLDLSRDPEFAPRPGWRSRLASLAGMQQAAPSDEEAARQTLRRLGPAITIARRGATYVIEVAARSQDPAKAARIANALAAAYIDAQIRAKVDVAADVQKRLAQQLESARAALREIDRKLDSFLDDSIGSIQDAELRTELSEIRAAIKEQEANRLRYDALAGRSRERARKREWDALIAELNSDRMVRLNEQAAAIRQGLEPGDGTDKAAKLAQLDRQIDKEAQSVIARIAAEASAAQQNEADLRARLGQRLAGPDIPAEIVQHFREVEGDAAALRLVVDKLTASSTAATAEIDLQLPDSRIVSPALPPSSPTSPDEPLIATLALALSLMLGGAAAILRDRLAGGFADEAALEDFAGVPVLAALPPITPQADRPGEKPATEILDHPGSAYAVAIRRLRLALDFAPSGGRRAGGSARVVLVTAALPGEGATQTAISLARCLALSGHRTLLIDGNLRQPEIHAALDLERRHGLSDILAGRGPAGVSDRLTVDDVTPHLAVAAGPGDPRCNVDALLESGSLSGLLQAARQGYDHVVIDSPALLPTVDTLFWIRHADDILMVVDAATAPQDIRAGLRALARGGHGTAHLWLALNRAAGRRLARGAPSATAATIRKEYSQSPGADRTPERATR